MEYATRVFVDPLNNEAWDLLKVHADLLEDGALLKRVSLVYKHQRLRLRIPVYRNMQWTYDLISLVVKEISTRVDHNVSPWPLVGYALEHSREDIEPKYALLRSDTEIILTPMARTDEEMGWSKRMQLIPAVQDVGRDLLAALKAVTPILHSMQHVSVGCILIHPDSNPWSAALSRPDWVEVRLEGRDSRFRGGAVARVVICGKVRESCAGTDIIFLFSLFHSSASVMKIVIRLTRDDSFFFQLILLRKF